MQKRTRTKGMQTERRCNCCGETKPLTKEFFNGDNSKLLGFENRCKICRKESHRKRLESRKKTETRENKHGKPEESSYGFVYLLKCNEFYKIGNSQDTITLYERIRTIQTGNPYEIKKIHTIETKDRFKLEQELHKQFKHKHVKGEWFELIDGDIEDILNYKSEL